MAIERTMVQIRERSLFDLLDLGLVLLRRRPVTLGLAALLGLAPFAAFNAWFFGSVEELNPTIPLTLWMIEAPWATAPLTVVLGGLMFGQRPTLARVIGALLKASLPLLLVHGLLRFLLFFWIPTRLAFANEVILLERGKWWKIFGRGRDLASGRGAELWSLAMIQIFLTYLFATCFYTGVARVGQAVLAETLTWDTPGEQALAGWRYQLPIWLVVSFFAIVRFLIYIDQRIRLEGWEVELRLREVARTMEEARRW